MGIWFDHRIGEGARIKIRENSLDVIVLGFQAEGGAEEVEVRLEGLPLYDGLPNYPKGTYSKYMRLITGKKYKVTREITLRAKLCFGKGQRIVNIEYHTRGYFCERKKYF